MQFGKLDRALLGGRKECARLTSTNTSKLQPVLDYILEHVENDERPYLKVQVLGSDFLGLLDSGASRTVVGSSGWKHLQKLGFVLDTSKKISCRVANGQMSESVGECHVPFSLRDQFRIVPVLVMLEVPHMLILGADFWKLMGVVPDLRHNEWHFSNLPETICTIAHLTGATVLSDLQKARLNAVVERNKTLMGTSLGRTNVTEHHIVCHAAPIKQRYYPVSPVMQTHINRELDEMINLGVVEKSKSPWSSPILLVKKKDGSYRFCVDFRKLNAVTERDSYPLPYIQNTLDKLRNAHYLTTLDIRSAYWQVGVAESSRPYTAFTVPGRGLFQFTRMPFGLHNAPATWQRLIDEVLGPELEPKVFTYLDDVVILTETFEEHLAVLEEVFRRLREANLTVSWEKCHFCRPQLKYLGYVVDGNGLHVDPDKVKAMLLLPPPKSVKDVRGIIGTFSWYRRFIPEFSSLISPITALLRKGRKFLWTSDCEASFCKIKECLVKAPVLSCPNYSLPFIVQCDASNYGLGAVLIQPHPDGERVISYLSRSLSKSEKNFSVTEKECLAVLWAIEKLRPYLEGVPFTVVTDHYSLVWLQNLKDPTGRLARWSVRLQQYDFKIVHRAGKDHVVPDTLSRHIPDENDESSELMILDLVNLKDSWYKSMVQKVSNDPVKYSQWRVLDGKLYKYIKSSFPSLDDVDNWKEVVPKDKRNDVLSRMHEPPLAGHMGILKTYKRICQKYYWPKLRYDVAKFVRKCTVCAAHKSDQGGPRGFMTPQPRATRPWEIIATDLMGPLPRSKSGYRFILVVVDLFSKFTLTFPLRSSTAHIVSKHLEEDVFLLFGVPRLLLCDNGPQYTSKIFTQLMKEYGVSVRYNAFYNPQSNPTERYNRTLKTMLSMYVSDNHREWDVNLPKITCAVRTSFNESSRQVPYFVNFGRNMILNGNEFIIKDRLIESDVDRENVDNVREKALDALFKDVRQRLDKASSKNERTYNLRRRHDEFLPNQLVWRKNFVSSDAAQYFTSKLAPKWIGPFLVKKKVSPWTYALKDERDNDKGVWNIKDLKPASAVENSHE